MPGPFVPAAACSSQDSGEPNPPPSWYANFTQGACTWRSLGFQLKHIMQAELHKVRNSDCLAHVFMGLPHAEDVRSRIPNPAGTGTSSRIRLARCDSSRIL